MIKELAVNGQVLTTFTAAFELVCDKASGESMHGCVHVENAMNLP